MLKVRGPYDINTFGVYAAQYVLKNLSGLKNYVNEVMSESKPMLEKYLKAKNIPQVISINKSKKEVVNDIFLMKKKIAKNLQPKLILTKHKVDKLFKDLVNEAQ